MLKALVIMELPSTKPIFVLKVVL